MSERPWIFSRRGPVAWLALSALSLLACQLVSPRGTAPSGQATATPGRVLHPPTRAAPTQAAPTRAAPTPAGPAQFSVGPAALSFLAPPNAGGKLALDESQLPFLALFPDLQNAPAPDWLQGGARVTYRVQSATIPQIQGQQSASGAGYVQYDVVALGDTATQPVIVATSKLYLDSVDGAGVVPSLVFPVLGLPGTGEFWLNPQSLTDAEQVVGGDLSVTRMDQDFAGQTYHAVRFEYTHGNAQYAWMFDQDSGVLLFFSWAIGTDADPSRQLGQVSLAGQRQLDLPWHDGVVPDWVAQTQSLHYSGDYETTVAGSPPVALNASATVTLQDHSDHWDAYRLSSTLQGQAASAAEHLTGGDQIFDGLWLAPEALDALQDGQSLDTDPITGAVISVARDDRTVTLTETGQRYQTSLTYDGTDGRLLQSVQQQQLGVATLVTRLKLDSSN